jgi:hypothetical protein
MKRSELEEIIREEINSYLAEREKRAAVGKNKDGKYTSAGTVPAIRNRTMSPAQIARRKTLGSKLLNMWRRGGKKGDKIRQAVKTHAANNEISIDGDRKKAYSIIWAIASDRVLSGRGDNDD